MRVKLSPEKIRGCIQRWQSMLDYLDPEPTPSGHAVLLHFQNRTKGWRDILAAACPEADDHAAFHELLDEICAFDQIVSKMLLAITKQQSTSIEVETPNSSPNLDATVDGGISSGKDEVQRCERRYDDWGQMDNRVILPAPVVKKVQDLIRQDDVRSVSCPYDDREVWEALVQEQVRRATASGLLPQDAFFLSGPDGGLWDTPVEEWGGYCHIPYEGLCGGDLLVRPTWRKFRIPQGIATGKLSTAASVSCCYYVLSPEDFGEVPFAYRESIGDGWVLYKSNLPYVPCNPLAGDVLSAPTLR